MASTSSTAHNWPWRPPGNAVRDPAQAAEGRPQHRPPCPGRQRAKVLSPSRSATPAQDAAANIGVPETDHVRVTLHKRRALTCIDQLSNTPHASQGRCAARQVTQPAVRRPSTPGGSSGPAGDVPASRLRRQGRPGAAGAVLGVHPDARNPAAGAVDGVCDRRAPRSCRTRQSSRPPSPDGEVDRTEGTTHELDLPGPGQAGRCEHRHQGRGRRRRRRDEPGRRWRGSDTGGGAAPGRAGVVSRGRRPRRHRCDRIRRPDRRRARRRGGRPGRRGVGGARRRGRGGHRRGRQRQRRLT